MTQAAEAYIKHLSKIVESQPDAERGHESAKDVNHRLDVVMRETDKCAV